ncbi:hypothetical protein [Thiocystis violacea]|uniref:hypothetical protein n=1 Tax=Thiocystis violacea TaxID=13725 RepID=UPI001907B26B|nr:hypothetical protein [Thiocystis violacea]
MSTSGTQTPAHDVDQLTGRIEESFPARVSQVKDLIRERRKLALTFRRTQTERDRVELEHIDQELAKHHIDIPAIQEQVAMRKEGLRKPVPHSEESVAPLTSERVGSGLVLLQVVDGLGLV